MGFCHCSGDKEIYSMEIEAQLEITSLKLHFDMLTTHFNSMIEIMIEESLLIH